MLITVGEIIKVQGIKGEIKVNPLTDDKLRFKKLKQIYINNVSYVIKTIRFNDEFVFLTLNGINDRNSAQKLVGYFIEIERENSIDLPANSFFIADIIGCDVYLSDNSLIGKVDYIYQNGAADVYEVVGKKNVMFPFLNKLIVSVDLSAKKIILKKDEFDKVAVYED